MIRALIVAPLPPPLRGGIANWARLVRDDLVTRPNVAATYLDTSVRWRRETNTALAVRLAGGSLQALRDASRLSRALRRERPTVVHLCTSGGLAAAKDVLMLRAARRAGVPSVLHCHHGALPGLLARSGPSGGLTRLSLRLATRVVVLDAASEAAVRHAVPEADVLRLPNPVALVAIDRPDPAARPAPAVPAGAARVVFAGHVVPAKGVRELVEACLWLAETPWILDLVGPVEPAFRAELLARAGAAGQADRLRFHGRIAHGDVLQFLRAADVFALPSHTEGAPNVVLEAMACGRAIVASGVGAIPEQLDADGPASCGICVPPGDVAALRGALAALLVNPSRRAALGRRARRRAEAHYATPVACGPLVDLWDSLAPAPRAVDPARSDRGASRCSTVESC